MQENQEIWVQSLGWEDPLEEEMATHSSILAWIFHGQRSLADCSPWGCKELEMTEWLSTHNNDIVNCIQFSSVAQSCPILCDPMNCSTSGLLVHHQHPEFIQTHVHWVSDAIQPSHPLSSPSPPAPNPSHHQSLFQWVNCSHEVAKVLEFQL